MKEIYGASISKDATGKNTLSSADGNYSLFLKEGLHTISFRSPGFQTKIIDKISIRNKTTSFLNIILFPLSQRTNAGNKNDSLKINDSLIKRSIQQELNLPAYNRTECNNCFGDINSSNIDDGADQNVVLLLKRLNGAIVQDAQRTPGLQSLNISGLGERYNQLSLNGLPINSQNALARAYPLGLIPAQSVNKLTIQTVGNASIPGDFSGGAVDIQFKEMPDRNFFYIQATGGFISGTTGKPFYSDQKGKWEFMSFPGSIRDMPTGFPTTRSAYTLNQKNPQEQVYLSKGLRNNLDPERNSKSMPNEKVVLGFGKLYSFKKGKKLGITAFINQSRSEETGTASVQVAPDVISNPFPFTNPNKALIRFQSQDTRYRNYSDLSGTINASLLYGRNKISFNSFLSNEISNSYSQRSMFFKPDEDINAHSGILYSTTQRSSVNTQLTGEHALGGDGKFKLNWQFRYTYTHQKSPDERNFLLRQDSVNSNLYEIAHSNSIVFSPDPNNVEKTDPNLINTSRKWKEFTDQGYTASVNLLVPFNLLQQSQVISGGVYIQNTNRVFHSDLLFIQGNGYFPLDQLLSSERYFPGGLSIKNYHVNNPGSRNVYANQLGNYTGSSNIGATYIRLENHITRRLSADWGIRLETSSQLVSNTQYNYITGFRNPQLTTLDENIHTGKFDFLPSVSFRYDISKKFDLYAAWFSSVNRPQIQELTKFRDYDAFSSLVTMGNPILRSSSISNYDAGINWFPNSSTNITLGGFYKQINDPIENILSSYTPGTLLATVNNTPKARISGIKASFKIDLGSNIYVRNKFRFSVFANGNLIKSEVDKGPVRSYLTPSVNKHSLSGSPDYTANAGLIFYPTRFTVITVLYNITGDYISAVGSGKLYTLPDGNSYSAIPDYRVKGRQQLDLQLSQKLLRERFQVTAGVNNLLGEGYTEYQDLNGNKKFDGALLLITKNGVGGFYSGGVDNTLVNVTCRQSYYITLSYIFK